MTDTGSTEHYATRLILDGAECWYGADAPGFDHQTAYDTMFKLLFEHVDLHHPRFHHVTVSVMKKTGECWERQQDIQFNDEPEIEQDHAA